MYENRAESEFELVEESEYGRTTTINVEVRGDEVSVTEESIEGDLPEADPYKSELRVRLLEFKCHIIDSGLRHYPF